jgi:release factor glutamine methyltransferase
VSGAAGPGGPGGDGPAVGPGDPADPASPEDAPAVPASPAVDLAAPAAPTVGAAVRRLTDRFAAAGLDSPRLDAELLVADAIGADRARLFLSPDRPLTPDQDARIAAHEDGRAVRRASVAHLVGTRGFRMLDLAVDGRVLIPRPETELLVELGLELPTGSTVVDVGTGSGAIALALADERPDLVIHATDVSEDALDVARENARVLGSRVAFHHADLLDGLPPLGTPLAVLSNPPYVPDGDLADLPPEVADHDPHLALFGGPDGLDVVRRLLPAARAAGAVLVGVEIGRGQADATVALPSAAGFPRTEIRDDLAGIGRVVVGRIGGAP